MNHSPSAKSSKAVKELCADLNLNSTLMSHKMISQWLQEKKTSR